MRFPQLIVFEDDGRLSAVVAPLAEESGCTLRRVQQVEACRRSLQRGGPNVLVLRTGRDLDREFALLDQISRTLPETRSIVVLDRNDVRLTALAWDLGATCVLPMNQVRDGLLEVVRAFLTGPG